MKSRQDNDITDHTSVVYAKIGIELSWSSGQDVVFDKDASGQQRD